MSRIKKFDIASEKRRIRVRRHREIKKIKASYSNRVHEQINSLMSSYSFDESNHVHEPALDPVEFSDKTSEIKNKLKLWAVNHRITRNALSDLLVILIFAGMHFLPKDARTFMQTPVKVSIDVLSNGQLFYYGIKKCLGIALNKIKTNCTCTLDFNFDGFPISKSSSKQFWPILSSIKGAFRKYSFSNFMYTFQIIINK